MTRIGYQTGENPTNNVAGFVERHAKRCPDRTIFLSALTHTSTAQALQHEVTSYGDFAESVRHLSAGLAELGIRKGDRALLFLPMAVPMYLAMTALQRLGAAPVFLDSWARKDSLGIAAQVTEPRAIISFPQAFEALTDVPELASIPIRICAGAAVGSDLARLEDLLATSAEDELASVASEDTALITFTTGSSGEPKGANRTHRFLAAQHEVLETCLPYGENDIDLPAFPIFSLNNIASGTTTLLPAINLSAPSPQDPEILLKQMNSCPVTCTTLSPSLFNGLSEHCLNTGARLTELRRVVTGGAPISKNDLGRFRQIAPNARILVLYGSTEVEPIAHIEASEALASQTDDKTSGVDVGCIHPALTSRFIRITGEPVTITTTTDWLDLEVAPGDPGELIVAGEHVCQDYFNNPNAFLRAKIKDIDGTLYHRTGDVGRIDSRGHLWIEGRVHNAISRDGKWVFPVQPEILLNALAFVQRTAYLGLPDPILGERCVCVVVLADATSPAAYPRLERYRKIIEDVLADHNLQADDILFRDQIPLDPRHHSKVEYELLRQEILKEEAK